MKLPLLDLLVFLAYLVGMMLFGCSFLLKKDARSSAAFTSGVGHLPAWAIGMSIFATFVSSISFLGLPAKAYAGNWNAFVFSLSIPVASVIAVKFFVPLYRSLNSISAYHYLELRFGAWAAVYASACYLLTQLARIGTILYLLALPMHALLGWSVPLIITITALSVLVYSVAGGIQAVIWTDAVQGILLIAGTVLCLLLLIWGNPPGAFSEAWQTHKFSLGSFSVWEWQHETFWVCLLYGIFINLQNYGIDQNYVQRYLTAKNTREAVQSTLFGSLLYIPVSFLFFAMGTALYGYYRVHPLPEAVAKTPDQVLPYFIVNGLPQGVTGLLIAAIFAAGMSTISTSINSGATILFTDYYRRFWAPAATERAQLRFLRWATLAMTFAGWGCAMALLRMEKGALDAWWMLASIFSGGMLGLFLLGYCCRRATRGPAMVATLLGILVIVWIVVGTHRFGLPCPLHPNLAIVMGTLVIFLVGFGLATWAQRKTRASVRDNG